MTVSRRTVLAALPLIAVAARAEPDAKARLVAAYPQFLERATADAILWRDGTTMAWDDGRSKTFDEKLAHASLADQMSLIYPRAFPVAAPDDDPGRFRNLAFFRKMYGATATDVRRNLVPVPWRIGDCRAALTFTSVNGVAAAAAKIVAELAALPAPLHQFVVPPSGSFAWRPIAGTKTLSAHAFGIAVDINAAHADYWRWKNGWRNRIPAAIVEVFERHGFIWGGKWHHVDTMHFEYRPELLG